MLDDLKEKYPNYDTLRDDIPCICPVQLGYEEERHCKDMGGERALSCKECWNRPLEEVKKWQLKE